MRIPHALRRHPRTSVIRAQAGIQPGDDAGMTKHQK
jgi:hypothetical protein